MPTKVSFFEPHREASAFIRGKPVLSREVFDQLLPELRARAFTVTGIEAANILENLRDQIAALPEGKPWDEVKADLVETVTPFLGDAAERRAELLLRIHGFQAFQAATWRTAQLDEDTTHLQYLTMEDDRVRPAHQALDGVVLPKDDPFWETHTPPWDWGCRCRIRPLNPDQVALIREQDRNKPPEAQRVIEGPAIDQLRHGRRITPEGQAVDVTPPSQKPGGQNAFTWDPGSLALPLSQLQGRYAPEVWETFIGWARGIEIRPGLTLEDWLIVPARLSTLPEPLQTWRRLGLPRIEHWTAQPAVGYTPPRSAGLRLTRSVTVTDVLGRRVHADLKTYLHWGDPDRPKPPQDIQRRLQILDEALVALQQPHEVWMLNDQTRVYLRKIAEEKKPALVAVLVDPGDEVRTFFMTRDLKWSNSLRTGVRLWPKEGGQ
ncbi:MAG: phage minor head protein [Verrucomicrobiae bacterium]|nr:phage minor head protein [Verrucomicrobiae bacterium]MDW8309203.1 phage minor head protein [Verrucomicrobiales bacterium]